MNGKSDDRPAGVFQNAADLVYRQAFGALDPSFLGQSVSCLRHREPLCLPEDASVHDVMLELQKHRFGCVLLLNPAGQVSGIFSERDYVLKVYNAPLDPQRTMVKEVMTRDPVTQPPDAPLAHVLNLMSNGGFRHIPIVDDAGAPLWMVSVKNIVDHLVSGISDALLDFKTNE